MAGKVTYKNLFSLVAEQIDKRTKFDTTSHYKDQSSRSSVSPIIDSSRLDVNTAQVVLAIQDLLSEALPSTIIEGLEVTATTPISATINVSAGTGSVGGVLYTLEENTTLTIPFNTGADVLFITLYKNNILLEQSYSPNKLTIAKIMIPKHGITSLVQDTKDNSWNAYIVNFREVKLYEDGYGKLEEDSIEFLRDNISPILSKNLIGDIELSENLKIINTQGNLELDSNSLKLMDINDNIISKFGRNGVYFYDVKGIEMARFTNIDARIGNILVKKNSIQSNNFVEGVSGFRIKDDGTVEFGEGTFRGTLSAPDGIIGGFTITPTKLYGGIIQTGENVGAGQNGVVMDVDGLRVYDDVLGLVVNLPSDGSAPYFSSGIINEVIFEISTNAVLRTSETVGDGSALSAGILINNNGLYGCEPNQLLSNANLKALIDGSIKLKGEIQALSGTIGGIIIQEDRLLGGLIMGSVLRSSLIETSDVSPRVRIDSTGLYYQSTTNIGKYGASGSGSYGFKYGDGTLYGAGVLAYLFKTNSAVFSVECEYNYADLHLYNRLADPISGTHRIGDLICVDGKLKICISGGSPGTFQTVGLQS